MPELAGHAIAAAHDAAVENDASADARAERQQHQVVHVTARSEPLLTERRRVGVVLQDDGRAEPLVDFIAQRKAFERWQVRRVLDDAFFQTDEAGNGHADARALLLAKALPQRLDGRDNVAHHRLAALPKADRPALFAEELASAVHSGSA